MYYWIRSYRDGKSGFEFYKTHPSGSNVPERIRLEIVNGLSKAAIQSGDLESYAHSFESAVVGPLELGSKKRFDEAVHIFRQEMPEAWRTNGSIRDLIEKYRLEREE